MRNKLSLSLLVFIGYIPFSASAESTEESPSWVDQQHTNVKSTLHSWSNSIDDWFGEPDPDKPASANLRIILDNEWNRYDGYSIKPRIRGKIRLPTLKKHVSVVFGDEDLDNQARDKNQLHRNYKEPIKDDKKYDSKQARDDNASLALRWSDGIKNLGIDTDLDLGVRSGADIFVRLKLSKVWQHDEQFSTRLEPIYRYGINSKHYFRINLENKFDENEKRFINNHTYIEYTHDQDEQTVWGNSLYRQHNYSNHKQLNYGLFFGGDINGKQPELDYYGPFINWRQPILRQWFFIQPELHYYNDKNSDRSHHIGAFLRLEAIF
ncbi:hypothetical protein [Glaesserella sp.]|uniref:hypothetical protein n=1 Tax=Glaesserella sp. TaxID=2094731 RepID=UPI00359FE4B7